MVMRPGPDRRRRALTVVRHRPYGPWWLWAATVLLVGIAAYATYLAKVSSDMVKRANASIAELSLQAEQRQSQDVAAAHKVSEAIAAREEAERALKQVRGDVDAANALVRDLKKRVTAAEADAETTRKSAKASKEEAQRAAAEAERAKAAFAQVKNLQERVAALKAEADAEREAKSVLEREVSELKREIADLRRQLDGGTTASTGR